MAGICSLVSERSGVIVLVDSGAPSFLSDASLRKMHLPTMLAWERRRVFPTLAPGGEKGAVGEDVERLKRRMPLLDYLRQQNWAGRPASRFEYVGLCPLHKESQPSFYVNTRKNVFYCHGCGQGGNLIRLVQLLRGLSFQQSLACLDPGSLQTLIPAQCWSWPQGSINSNWITVPR